jgi:hypothetical protein
MTERQPAAAPVAAEAAKYRGYAALGTGNYIINHSGAGEVPELCISLATAEDKRTRTIGDSIDNEPGSLVLAEEMVVRLRFANRTGWEALNTQLQLLRDVHFPSANARAAACDPPAAAEQVESVTPAGPHEPEARQQSQAWRNDALEAAAQIVERYANPNAADMARDIRALIYGSQYRWTRRARRLRCSARWCWLASSCPTCHGERLRQAWRRSTQREGDNQ